MSTPADVFLVWVVI